jgi:HK97 family phage major capsid protein
MHSRIMSDVRALAALYRPTWSGISAAIAKTGVPTMDATALVDKSPREALKEIDAELSEARGNRPDLEKKVEESRDAYIKAGMPGEDSAEFRATEEAIAERGGCLDKISELDGKKTLILEALGQSSSVRTGRDGPVVEEKASEHGWDSKRLLTDPEQVQYLKEMSQSKARVGNVELGEVQSRDAFAAELSSTEDMRRGQWLGIVPQLRRRLRIVDLIPVATMDENTLPYTKESGSFAGAKTVKEGLAKPEAGPTWTDAEAHARTLAVFYKVRKQILSDVSAMRGIIDSRLRYEVELLLETEVLLGKGADPELEGILATTGLGVVKYNASTVGTATYTAEQILRSITTVFLANAEADGIVLAPTDWQTALLSKSTYEASAGVTGGSGEFIGGGPFSVTPMQLWGLPVVVSPSMKENEALVGAFGLGAGLFIREGVNVLMSDSDQDDFIKNKLTLLAEMRAALAVYRPAAFCKTWLTKAAEEAGN